MTATKTKVDPKQLITRAFGGKTFKASRRTFAHLDYTQKRLDREHPGAKVEVIQGCYNSTVKASAGTHDKDAVLDVRIVGLDWWAAQWFLRQCGWAAWYRHTGSWASVGNWHIHMISLGFTTQVGVFIDGGASQGKSGYTSQVTDYYKHTYGLADQHNVDLDKSQFPGDTGPAPWPVGNLTGWRKAIDATIFDFALWEQELEDEMSSPKDWDKDDWAAFNKNASPAIAKAVVDQPISKDGESPVVSLGQGVNQTRNAVKK